MQFDVIAVEGCREAAGAPHVENRQVGRWINLVGPDFRTGNADIDLSIGTVTVSRVNLAMATRAHAGRGLGIPGMLLRPATPPMVNFRVLNICSPRDTDSRSAARSAPVGKVCQAPKSAKVPGPVGSGSPGVPADSWTAPPTPSSAVRLRAREFQFCSSQTVPSQRQTMPLSVARAQRPLMRELSSAIISDERVRREHRRAFRHLVTQNPA